MLPDKKTILEIKSFITRRTVIQMIIAICISLATSYIGNGHIPALKVGDVKTVVTNGILSLTQSGILIHVTATDRKIGFQAVMTFLAISVIPIIMGMIATLSFYPITGVGLICFTAFSAIIVHSNMNKIAKNEDELYRLAYNDSLTGLPNRRAFDEHLNELINSGKNKKFALAVIDLDNFKRINDTIGHECGDGVLCEAARRWSCLKKPNEFIARQGGDEFILIINNYGDELTLKKRMAEYLEALSYEMNVMDNCFYASASFGLACFPEHAASSEKLFRFADMAMYQAKSSKTDKVRLFNMDMVAPVENEYLYDRLIRSCLLNGNFDLAFQPQYDTKTKKFRGFEALIRMKDDYDRYISPDKFIPYAEKSRLILNIDRWVLDAALTLMSPYYSFLSADFTLSVNISAVHLQHESLYDDIKSALEKTKFPPQNLEIEITETTLVSSVASAEASLKRIKDLGIRVALDDFGTGYASLSMLTEIPLDLIKIDKIFMDKLLVEPKYKSFVSAIVSIAHIFGFEVVTEGVEYEVQLELLKKLGCDYVQGYIWSKPLDRDAADVLLKNLYPLRPIEVKDIMKPV